MKIFTKIDDWNSYRSSLNGTIGFVPTMGALHEGHASLLKAATKNHTHSVLSIYVNPTQFGPNEDLSKYPRTLDADLKIAEDAGVSAVFLPTNEDLYPHGFSTYVNEESISKVLCGIYRPTHFRGVTTIVLKLLGIIRPTETFFGLKDAQQFYIISKMINDLNLSQTVLGKVTGLPTIREESGLALSSRNRYLNSNDREVIAPQIYQELVRAKTEVLQIQNKNIIEQIAQIEQECCGRLTRSGFEVQYFELRTLPHFELPSSSFNPQQKDWIIAFAGILNGTRLIDNIITNK